MTDLDQSVNQDITEVAKHGLYYNVNKRKKAGTSRDAGSPKAPTAQAWKDAAKTAKKESVAEDGLPNVDQVDRQKMIITLDGQEYPLIKLSPTDIRPRSGQQVQIACAQMGERCLGHYNALLAGGRVFVLPKESRVFPEQGVAEGRRPYDDLRDTGFGRPERDMSDESNLLYIYKNDRIMQKMVSNRVEREARAQGYRDTPEQALKMHGIVKSKFKPGKWVQKQGDSWVTVYPFGKPDDVAESATLGATSAANMGVGAVYKNKPVSQPKNKDGTAKNALDMKGANLLGGGSIKR